MDETEMIMQIHSDLKYMNQRMDGHGETLRGISSKVESKFDDIQKQMARDKEHLLEKIHSIDKAAMKENGKIATKVSSLIGVVTLIMSWLMKKL